MIRACLELRKIWEEGDFFEINMLARSPFCQVNINFYTTNEELEGLKRGLAALTNEEEFVWTSGADTDNVTHYIYFRFFICSKRGHVAIEILTDNKLSSLYNARTNFYVITEIGSLDDFTNQLDKLIKGTEDSVQGIIYSEM